MTGRIYFINNPWPNGHRISTAFHRIRFDRADNDAYTIHWQGKAALTYAGDEEFKYDFKTTISALYFKA